MNTTMPPRIRTLNRPPLLPRLIFLAQLIGGAALLGVAIGVMWIGLAVLSTAEWPHAVAWAQAKLGCCR